MSKCTTCEGALYTERPGNRILKFNETHCSDLCYRYRTPFVNREPPDRAPKSPEEIQDRIRKWRTWMTMTKAQADLFIQTSWTAERKRRRDHTDLCNSLMASHKRQFGVTGTQKTAVPVFEPPPYVSKIPFPLDIFPEPATEWQKEERKTRHPKCTNGWIHPEAAVDGNFADCELVHPGHIAKDPLPFHTIEPGNTAKWIVTPFMSDFTY